MVIDFNKYFNNEYKVADNQTATYKGALGSGWAKSRIHLLKEYEAIDSTMAAKFAIHAEQRKDQKVSLNWFEKKIFIIVKDSVSGTVLKVNKASLMKRLGVTEDDLTQIQDDHGHAAKPEFDRLIKSKLESSFSNNIKTHIDKIHDFLRKYESGGIGGKMDRYLGSLPKNELYATLNSLIFLDKDSPNPIDAFLEKYSFLDYAILASVPVALKYMPTPVSEETISSVRLKIEAHHQPDINKKVLAKLDFARLCLSGKQGVEQSTKKAIKYCREVSQTNYIYDSTKIHAFILLGDIHSNSELGVKNIDQAIDYYRKAANFKTQWDTGMCSSLKWEANLNLGRLYLEKAENLEGNDQAACIEAANKCLFSSKLDDAVELRACLSKDGLKKALELIKQQSENPKANLKLYLAQNCLRGTGGQAKSGAAAIKYCIEVCQAEHIFDSTKINAFTILGEIYSDSTLDVRNIDKAIDYYTKAADFKTKGPSRENERIKWRVNLELGKLYIEKAKNLEGEERVRCIKEATQRLESTPAPMAASLRKCLDEGQDIEKAMSLINK